MRTRAEIEREIASKRRERELYVSPQGVAKCHAEMDVLLDEWEATWPADEKSLQAT
jgi:hypothetical protein